MVGGLLRIVVWQLFVHVGALKVDFSEFQGSLHKPRKPLHGTNEILLQGPSFLANKDPIPGELFLDDGLAITNTRSPENELLSLDDSSYIFAIYHEHSALMRGVFNISASDIVQQSPENVHYVFMSYGSQYIEAISVTDAPGPVLDLELRLAQEFANLSLNSDYRGYWNNHIHFIYPNPLRSSLFQGAQSWFRDLLVQENWNSGPLPLLRTIFSSDCLDSDELESISSLGYVGIEHSNITSIMNQLNAKPFEAVPARQTNMTDFYSHMLLPIAYYGLGCGDEDSSEPVQDVKGKIALIARGECEFTKKYTHAYLSGAKAVVIFTQADNPVESMTQSVNISAVMIENEPGALLKEFLLRADNLTINLTATFDYTESTRAATFFAIDRFHRVRKFGLLRENSLNSCFDEILYYNFEAELQLELESFQRESNYRRVELWNVDVPNSAKIENTSVEIPDWAYLKEVDKMYIEFETSCGPGHWYYNCGEWDYLVYVYIITADGENVELGRWINGYRSEGHWMTDISHNLALLGNGGTIQFERHLDQDYYGGVTLHFWSSGERLYNVQSRNFIHLFYAEDPFDDTYNSHNRTLMVDINDVLEQQSFCNFSRSLLQNSDCTPVDKSLLVLEEAYITAFVTGHGFGWDEANCAEFCNSSHLFWTNYDSLWFDFPTAGTDEGCQEQVLQGVSPNQYGTWYYGRAGWCPSLDVPPKVLNITDSVHLAQLSDTPLNISYEGYYNGTTPHIPDIPKVNGTGFGAVMRINSYIILEFSVIGDDLDGGELSEIEENSEEEEDVLHESGSGLGDENEGSQEEEMSNGEESDGGIPEEDVSEHQTSNEEIPEQSHEISDESAKNEEMFPFYCGKGTFKCLIDGHTICIPLYQICDGQIQCDDSSDETNCRDENEDTEPPSSGKNDSVNIVLSKQQVGLIVLGSCLVVVVFMILLVYCWKWKNRVSRFMRLEQSGIGSSVESVDGSHQSTGTLELDVQ